MLDCFVGNKRKVKIGFAPVRRAAWLHKPFNLPEAIRQKEAIQSALGGFDAEFATLDGILPDGFLFDAKGAELAAAEFIRLGVDGVFLPHCNFGSEEAAARLCKAVGKPVLLWGPKDYVNPDDLYRYRDSQCGMFASSKVLSMYGVEFTYIENCDADDQIFKDGMDRFLAVCSVVKAFRGMRVGQISTRPAPFASVKANEMELLEKFGIEVIPITFADLRAMFEKTLKERADEVQANTDEMKRLYSMSACIEESHLAKISALKLAVEQWGLSENLSAAVTMCWGPMIDTIGISPCFALGDVCDDGFPFICEGDIHGAVSAVMAMAAARYSAPIFLADITIRHPTDKNAELLWHCGVFAKSLAKPGEPLVLMEHYNRLCPAVGAWELKGGQVSIVRFDGMTGKYSIFLGGAEGTSGPKTVGSYLWIKVDDWSRWERKLIYGPYIHHCVGIHADVLPILEEACRYIPGLAPDLA
jgi:L-fucose isomerase-like protein